MDTQVLAMILTRASGQRLSAFAEEHLWSKVGFGSDATWLLDNAADRTELAFGILGATTRDWARFGWLYLNGGVSPSLGTRILCPQLRAARQLVRCARPTVPALTRPRPPAPVAC